MIDSISFCVMHQRGSEKLTDRAIASILRQKLRDREIVLCGDWPATQDVQVIQDDGYDGRGKVGRVRNLLCSHATKDYVVLMAGNIELSDGWYDAIKEGDYFDVIGSRIVTDGNVRAVDWAYQIKIGPVTFPVPLDYDEWTTKAYVSGNLMLLRKTVWETIRFDETLVHDKHEDVDFCLRATRVGFRLGVIPKALTKYCVGDHETTDDVTFDRTQKVVLAFKKAFATGKNAFDAGNYDMALVRLTDAMEIVTGDPATLSMIGWSYYFTNRYDKAIQVFNDAITADSVHHSALRGRGWAFLQSGAYPSAVRDLTAALEFVNPSNKNDWVETIRGLAWSNYHCGKFEESIKYFDALRERSNEHEDNLLQDIYRGLGWCCYNMGRLDKAEDYFKKALAHINPNNRELLQDAKQGLDLTTLALAKPASSQERIDLPGVHLSKLPPSVHRWVAPITWCRGQAPRLKAIVRRILTR